ncbi:hypothetical protein OLMES_1740 [Oleiphilus messinensis]|uniref:Cyclic nucleotide-binding domain-containing protein n=1 Tax=Oleiphilus messinensis TaxID=141451 RepID=A0A1Y0I8L0_9GAMM|nr:cyclic nucleotide-binding domain-containing protein [Oleiphilus messinensis]ARU55815.1 hypothetical protein OLMES_1740 [Oleiphilus messinensis]
MNIDPEIAHKLDGVAAQESTLQSFETNEYIFRAGEPNTGCYRLCSGAITIVLPAGEDEISAIDLLPGYWFGQSPSEKEATFSFGVRCTAPCSVERLSWRVLKQTEAANRSATNFFDALSHHIRTIQILIQTFRKTYPEISVEFLEDLIRSANFMHLDENQLLYEQGNCAQVMYFLLSGKIDVYVGAGQDLNRVGEIYHGEPFS